MYLGMLSKTNRQERESGKAAEEENEKAWGVVGGSEKLGSLQRT